MSLKDIIEDEVSYALGQQRARYENYLISLISCLDKNDLQIVKEDIEYTLKSLDILPKEYELKG